MLFAVRGVEGSGAEAAKADYERYYNWVLSTELSDDVSGRVLEYSWHIIFGMDPV